MNRQVPLRRGKPLPRRTPLRQAGVKAKGQGAPGTGSAPGKLTRPAPSEFTPKVKRMARKRAGRGDVFDSRCERCGAGIGEKGGEFQHRAARGAGGCRDTVINGPANCAFLCPPCHRLAESRDPHLGMDAGGWWIQHGTTPEFDPRNVSILLATESGSGLEVWLAQDGIGDLGYGYSSHPYQIGVAA